MTIVGTSAVRVRIPFRRPFATAAGTWHERDAWMLTLHAADGRMGVGEAGLDPAADEAALDDLAAAVRAFVVSGTEPVHLAVLGAIEAARLDLGIATLDASSASTTVAVNATITTEDVEASVVEARTAVEGGFKTLKLKGGLERSTGELVARLAAVRDAIGPEIALRLDVNGSWDAATALERLAGLAPILLEYVEQPMSPDDLSGLARLRAVSPVPIALDESVSSWTAARAVLATGAADVLVVKPGRVGGPLVASAIAREAQAAGAGVAISTLLETGVGLTAALRVAACLPDLAHGLATVDVLVSDLLREPLEVRRGRMSVPAAGSVALDPAAVTSFEVEGIGPDR